MVLLIWYLFSLSFEELALNFLKEFYIKAVLKMIFERAGLCVADGNVKATVGWIILTSSH